MFVATRNSRLFAVFSLLLPLVAVLRVAQANLELQIDDAVIKTADERYFDESQCYMEIIYNDDGTNSLSTSVVITKEFPPDTMGHVYLMKYSMGDYSEPVGLDINKKMCEMLSEPLVGDFVSLIGFSADDCPPPVGEYSKDEFTIPLDQLPDSFPPGKYMMVLQIIVDGDIIFDLNTSVSIL